MKAKHEFALQTEITLARELIRRGEHTRAMHHLERAHVLGQRLVGAHVRVHWMMFTVEVARHRTRAAFGQLVRVVLGAIGSAIGVLPTGNTGGSDVDMFAAMPVDADLARVMHGEPS